MQSCSKLTLMAKDSTSITIVYINTEFGGLTCQMQLLLGLYFYCQTSAELLYASLLFCLHGLGLHQTSQNTK